VACLWKFKSFAEADLRVTSALQTMMSFDVNTSRSLSAINTRISTPTQVFQLSASHFHLILKSSCSSYLKAVSFNLSSHGNTQPSPLRSHPHIQTSVSFKAIKLHFDHHLTACHQNYSTWAANTH
jgi:hypothetical protein